MPFSPELIRTHVAWLRLWLINAPSSKLDSALSKIKAFVTTYAAKGPLRPATWLATSIIGHTLLSSGDDISAFRVQLHGRTGVF